MNTEKRYLVLREVRELYGIGRDLVTRLVAERQLHRTKVGKAWRYNRDDLEYIFSGGAIRRHIHRSNRCRV